jgi:hypothetical protein
VSGNYPVAFRDGKTQRKMKMTQAVTIQDTNLPATQRETNPWLEAAAEAGSDLGRLLKFVKGEWQIGDDTVAENTEYIAHVDQIARGWIKFADGKVVDQIIGKLADSFKVPQREELSDNDPAQWNEKDANGNPRDPWVKQWLLPMVSVDTSDVVTFVTSSKGGAAAIGSLCRVYGNKKRDGLLPIVALKTRSYKHQNYGRIETPELPIVGWDGTPMATPITQDMTGGAIQEAPPVSSEQEFEDEIPY